MHSIPHRMQYSRLLDMTSIRLQRNQPQSRDTASILRIQRNQNWSRNWTDSLLRGLHRKEPQISFIDLSPIKAAHNGAAWNKQAYWKKEILVVIVTFKVDRLEQKVSTDHEGSYRRAARD
jgi:hypothetical protein